MKNFEQNYRVELSDITTTYGLKPTAVLKYYQETFARYCAKHNVAGYDVYRMGLKWVFGQTIVKYGDVIPIWNEEVLVRVYISCVKKLRMYVNFEISTKRGLVAEGQCVSYVLDKESSRPQPMQRIVDYFNVDEDQYSGEILKLEEEQIWVEGDGFGFPIDEESYEKQLSDRVISNNLHKITFTDLDYNGHTNNISYVSLGLEGMPVDYIRGHFPKALDVRYLQETFLNDTLRCEIECKSNMLEHRITNEKDGSLVCLINSIWQDDYMDIPKFFKVLEEVK